MVYMLSNQLVDGEQGETQRPAVVPGTANADVEVIGLPGAKHADQAGRKTT